MNALRHHLPDTPVSDASSPGGVGFQPWNSIRVATPLARVQCRTIADVQQTLRIAQEFDTPLAVVGGRYDCWGRNLQEGAILLDLHPMSEVFCNAAAATVTFGGGTTGTRLLSQLPEGTAAITACNGHVGMVALTLGGGYGYLNNRFGLACDTLVEATLVLANGTVVTASSENEPDLFWALRGGGTGFGVVTSMTLRTFPVAAVLHTIFLIPLDQAGAALHRMQACLDQEPHALNIVPLFMFGPAGEPALFLSCVWTGVSKAGQELLSPFNSLTGAQVLKQAWVPCKDTLDPDTVWPASRPWYGDTFSFGRMDGALVDATVSVARAIPAPDHMFFFQGFHGAPTQVVPNATAFPLRTPHFVSAFVASWSLDQEHRSGISREWADRAQQQLAPYALSSAYINFLKPEDTSRVQNSFGTSAARLAAIRQSVDPHRIFNKATGSF